MSKGIDWASAPEGYPIWVESKVSTDISDWHRLESNGCLRDRKGARWEPWQVRDGECVPHYRPEWDGEDLPPVGTVCELKFGHWNEWEKCTVLCVGEKMIFVRQVTRSGEIFEGSMNRDGVMFRRIRTAEQIAADELQVATQQIMQDAGITDSAFKDDPEAWVWAAALHKAGYRKQVAP